MELDSCVAFLGHHSVNVAGVVLFPVVYRPWVHLVLDLTAFGHVYVTFPPVTLPGTASVVFTPDASVAALPPLSPYFLAPPWAGHFPGLWRNMV